MTTSACSPAIVTACFLRYAFFAMMGSLFSMDWVLSLVGDFLYMLHMHLFVIYIFRLSFDLILYKRSKVSNRLILPFPSGNDMMKSSRRGCPAAAPYIYFTCAIANKVSCKSLEKLILFFQQKYSTMQES